MPQKTWTSESDWAAGTHTNTQTDGNGNLVLQTGQATGYWTSPAYNMSDHRATQLLTGTATIPVGANVLVQVRFASTQSGLSSASWSKYYAAQSDGSILARIREDVLNGSITDGAWVQVRIHLERE